MGNVYYNHISEGVGFERIKLDADAKTFRVDKQWPEYGMDKNKAFYFGNPIYGSDGKTFEILHGAYQKDRYHVYYRN